jgi:hypothetical protein
MSRARAHLLRDWIYFAQRYCAAAGALDDPVDTHILPRIQLYGHAIECAFKAYLLSRGQKPPRGKAGHDLVNLAALAEDLGCHVAELQAVAVVQVSSSYDQDMVTSSLYKSRYPTEKAESRCNSVGDFEDIHELVNSICSQSST